MQNAIKKRAEKIYSEGFLMVWLRSKFVKEPDNIDEAVLHVLSFHETKQSSNKVYDNNQTFRKVKFLDSDGDAEESHDSVESRVAKSAPGKKK